MADNNCEPQREHEQETEVLPALRHDDAEWKIIQQNTFTRWVNNHLKKADDTIQNLETDFSDGLKLINLAMVLSQKNIGKYNKKVNFRSQKLENVSLALNFFQDVEKIKIINIDSSHIVDKNKKLILGLIWTLILHYSISMGWIVETQDGQPQEDTPKQKLLNWLRGHLPTGMPLTNFTSDWNDGIALGALVDSMAPGALPDWQKMHPGNALANTEKALEAAQEHLNVAPLITAAELIHPEIDDLSVMTYLSQFPTAKRVSSPTKPFPPVPCEPTVSGQFGDLDKHPIVNQPTEFEVSIQGDGYKPKVSIRDPEDKDVHHTVTKKNPHLFTIKYTPTTIGEHKIGLAAIDILSGESTAIPEASATVEALPAARLCPYPDRVRIGEEVPLRIEDAFNGPVELVVVDAEGEELRLPVVEGNQPGVHTAEYTPSNKGLHSINVFHRRTHIDQSPFALRVTPQTPEMTVWGRGLAADGVRVADKVPIHAQVNDSKDKLSPELFDVKLLEKGSGKVVSEVPVTSSQPNHCSFEYTPAKEGDYAVEVKYDGEHVAQSPYEVEVLPTTQSAVRAFGPGLRGGIAKEQSVFEVQTNGEADRLAFSIEGPSKTEIQCQDRGQGAALVAYTPKEAGVYKVNVLAGGEHIKDSPFVLMVDPAQADFHPGAARLTGLDPNTAQHSKEPVTFQIDTKRTGASDTPTVSICDSNMSPVSVQLHEMTPGQFEAEFVPEKSGPYYVDASLRGVAVPGAPFTVNVKEPVDISKLNMYGPGIDGPVVSQEPTNFTIDAKQAGPGAVEVSLADRSGQEVDIDVLDHDDGSFTVKYTAPRPGSYELNVVFAGEEIPPIEINVKPHVDVAGIRVEGLENAIVTVNCEKEVHVFTSDGENTRIVITSPSGRVVEAIIESTPSGLRVRFTPSEIGDYRISVSYKDVPIESSPFLMHSVPAPAGNGICAEAEYVVSRSGPARPDLVVVTGPGLGPVITQCSTHVIIDTTAAGFGDIDLFVDGPTRTPLHCMDNQDGTLTMYYVPKIPGLYWLRVMFDQKHIPGSPFQVVAVSPLLTSPSLLHPENEKTESPFTSLSSGSSSHRTTPVV